MKIVEIEWKVFSPSTRKKDRSICNRIQHFLETLSFSPSTSLCPNRKPSGVDGIKPEQLLELGTHRIERLGDSFGRARSIETPDGPCRWPVGGEKTRTVIPREEGSLLSVAQHAFGPRIEVTKRAMRSLASSTTPSFSPVSQQRRRTSGDRQRERGGRNGLSGFSGIVDLHPRLLHLRNERLEGRKNDRLPPRTQRSGWWRLGWRSFRLLGCICSRRKVE